MCDGIERVHPVLLRWTLPAASLPLGPTLAVLALLCLGSAALAARAGDRGRTRGALVVALLLGGSAAVEWRERLELGDWTLHAWGALLLVGLVAAWRITIGLARADGQDAEQQRLRLVAVATCALVGARALDAWLDRAHLESWRTATSFHGAGLALWGALAGGVIAVLVDARRARVTPWPALDLLTPGAALALALGRVGCWLHGCDFGTPSETPWARWLGTFPRWSVRGVAGDGPPVWLAQVDAGLISPTAERSLPTHPTQLYEALGALVLFFLALALRRARLAPGRVALGVLVAYGALRFAIEPLRADVERGLVGPRFSLRVLVPIGLALLGAAFSWGPARDVPQHRRVVVRALAAVPALVAAWVLRRSALTVEVALPAWCALVSGVLGSLAWVSRGGPPARAAPVTAPADT